MFERLGKLTGFVILFPTLVQFVVGQNTHRASISQERVAQAITAAGVKVLPDQVEFLSNSKATTADADLQVLTATPASDGTARVELRCQNRRECLPFYVVLHRLKPVGAGSESHGPIQLASLKDQAQGSLLTPQLVRGGDHATLILENGDSRISMPVICMQGGFRGQIIRVRSNDGKRLYQAEVVASNLLKGSL